MDKKNHDFFETTLSRREMTWGLRYLLFQLVFLPSLLHFFNTLVGNLLGSAELNFLFFVINFAAAGWIFRKFLLENGKIALARPGKTLLIAGAGFLVYTVCARALGWLFAWLDPGFANLNDQSIASISRENYPLMFVGTVILVPVAEEVFHRGLVFRGLYSRSAAAAWTVSTAVFAMIHVMNYVGVYAPTTLILCFLQYVPAGQCLGAAYRLSGSLAAPILIHAGVNALGMLAVR